MIIERECRECCGLGRLHSDGHTGDPMDAGMECNKCNGAGVVIVDCETGDEIEAR